MTTQDVQSLTPGQGCYAFFLNAQGRILGDVNMFCREDYFLLDTEPETRQKLLRSYRPLHYCRRCDARRRDREMATSPSKARRRPRSSNVWARQCPKRITRRGPGRKDVARVSSTGAGGYFIFLTPAKKSELIAALTASGNRGSYAGRSAHGSYRAREAALRRRNQRTLSGPGNRPTPRSEFQQRLLPGTGNRRASSQPRANSSCAAPN